jgi:hypothetical protein
VTFGGFGFSAVMSGILEDWFAVDIIAKVRDAGVRRKLGEGIRRTASGRRVMRFRMGVVGGVLV